LVQDLIDRGFDEARGNALPASKPIGLMVGETVFLAALVAAMLHRGM